MDETELRLLEQNLEIKQKQLFNFPSTLMPAEPIEIVQNIVWVKGSHCSILYKISIVISFIVIVIFMFLFFLCFFSKEN